MTEPLNVLTCLFDTARRQAQSQQTGPAVATLRRLCRLPGLGDGRTERAHALLGELLLRSRRYRAARRHLAVAARLDRACPRTFFLLGLAWHHDPRGDHDRAARHYARSLRLAPDQPRCLGEAGLLAVSRGDDEHGLDLLQRAVEVAPGSAAAVVRLCRGLCRAGRPEEALRAVRLALFRLPRSTALRQLSAGLLLDRLRCRQEHEACGRAADEPGPVVLPFLQVVGAGAKRQVRLHDPEPVRGPHLMRMRVRRGWRRTP